MTSEDTFSAEELRKDIETIRDIAERWRGKMNYLPADQQFAMFRRSVVHIEKAGTLVEKIISKFIQEDE